MKKILFEIRVATNIFSILEIFSKKKKIRSSLYNNGLKLLFDKSINFENYNLDFMYVDNTIATKKNIDIDILKILPKNTIIRTVKKNYYGKHNKGAGDIDLWKYNFEIIQNYDFLFHFEPRVQILNNRFILNFLNEPSNYFSLDDTGVQFQTGIFGINTLDLEDFIKTVNLDEMISKKISIETLLYDFYKNKKFRLYDNKIGIRFDEKQFKFHLI